MPRDPANTIYFRQARFSTRLPKECLYSPAHYWLEEAETGLWRIGLTRFATRMLGDFVEFSPQVEIDASVQVGETIGSVEGFKAVTDVFCLATGVWRGMTPRLLEKPDVVDLDPYDAGWLYLVAGTPADFVVDAAGYVEILNAVIEKMLAKESEKPSC